MSDHDREDLKAIKTFPSLVKYLRDELDWPIDREDFEDLVFDYEAEELGIDSKTAAKIDGIKQLRPLVTGQPWGIFFVKFEPKRLPVVALRRILSKLVFKKRASANRAEQATWAMNDLLFISAYGEDAHRQITFAHFAEDRETSDLPTLKVLGWDDQDTALHLDHVTDELHEKLCWPEEDDLDAWRRQWSSAFTLRHREVITTSKQLAIELADLARSIRKRVNAVLAIETNTGPMTKLMAAFREALIHDLEADDFADMYAQTIAYGLLSARISRPAGLVAENVADMVPITNPFLKELMETFLHLGGRRSGRGQAAGLNFDELGVNDVVELLRDSNMEAVLRDFDNLNPAEDPVIHFYEWFLKEYDAEKRMRRGVFYTPKPVVSFIVRSVHELLQSEFGLEDGLASTVTWGEMAERHKDLTIPEGTEPDSPFVVILDPATGTATFLVEAIDVIYRTMKAKWLAAGRMALEIPALWNEYVPKHLLPRLHGYELMMAPYAIAHMKIGLKLYETGYRFESDERARVYLTNALEPAQDFSGNLAFAIPALAHEAEAVNAIKRDQRFTVVIGNPPYSISSQNMGTWIKEATSIYKKDLSEINLNALSDDYVKFIRLSQLAHTQAWGAVSAMITSNTFLDGITHRQMRRTLMDTSDAIYIYDLHGSSRRGNTGPRSSDDQNVFDIMSGVSISIFVTLQEQTRKTVVRYCDLWGLRERKLSVLSSERFTQTNWIALTPQSNNWFFVPKNVDRDAEYADYWSVKDIYPISGSGIKFRKDNLLVRQHFTRDDVIAMLNAISDTTVDICKEYNFRETDDWKLEEKRQWFAAWEPADVRPVQYRPFDCRYTYYPLHTISNIIVRGDSRRELMRHMLEPNIALVATRQFASHEHFVVFTANTLVEISSQPFAPNTVFPLYLYEQPIQQLSLSGVDRRELRRTANISEDAMTAFSKQLELAFIPDGRGDAAKVFGPEDVFCYGYAILHSPAYRLRYGEQLRVGFPRLPVPPSQSLFWELVRRGAEVVAFHLLESPGCDDVAILVGSGDFQVEKVSYSDETVWLDKAKTCGFKGVPEEVWNFHIGGYQVCEKWLKDRQAKGGKKPRPGRVLTDEDIDHYQKIVVALHETIRIMAEIDEVIDQHGGWPDAFVTEPREK